MAEPCKVFRIERTAAARLPRRGGAPPSAPSAPPHGVDLAQVFGALHAVNGAAGTDADADAAARAAAQLARIADELDAVTAGTAQATQKILDAAEAIDRLADDLSAVLRGRAEQDLAADISDLVLSIFEACNFHDLIGQRIAKVMKTLGPGAPPPHGHGARHLHGPALDGEAGHMTQAEIDQLFGG